MNMPKEKLDQFLKIKIISNKLNIIIIEDKPD